jgi:tetratricopeptide (TPR) repeat protein
VLAQHHSDIVMAIEHLRAAAQLAEEIGLPGELWSIFSDLGTLHQQQGDQQQARAMFARAAEIVQSLAKTIEDTQQRAAFLAAPQVRDALERGT